MADDKPIKPVHLTLLTGGAAALDQAETLGPLTGDGEGGGADLRPVEYSDDAMGAHLVERLGDKWRALPDGTWRKWNGKFWEFDDHNQVKQQSRLSSRIIAHTTETKKVQNAVSSHGVVTAAIKFAQVDPRMIVSRDAFDKNPWLLNTPAGIVDLDNGRIGPHNPAEMMTLITAVSPGGTCPDWQTFLLEATGRDADLVKYLQALAGYCLTGLTIEQQMYFFHGPSNTGKTLFINILRRVLYLYAAHAPMTLFLSAMGERHPTDLTILERVRLVTASETEANKPWDEALVKNLTGADPITAHKMRQDNFTFVPKCKLVMAGNYRPVMRSPDDAMRRRINMIPFLIKPKKIDMGLEEKLARQGDGILGWAIEGVALWKAGALKSPPVVVVAATNEYFDEENPLKDWLDQFCRVDRTAFAETRALYKSFQASAKDAGTFVLSEKRFSLALKLQGFKKGRNAIGRMGFVGLALLVSQDELPYSTTHHHAAAGGGGERAPIYQDEPGSHEPDDGAD